MQRISQNLQALVIFSLILVFNHYGFAQTSLVPVDISTFNATTTYNGSNIIQPGGDKDANQFEILTATPKPFDRIDLVFDLSTTENGLVGLTVSIWSDSGTPTNQPQAQLGSTFVYTPNTATTDSQHKFARFTSSTPFNNFYTTGPGKYWLVLGPTTEKVQWAKTTSNTQIVNSLGSAAVNPFQLQYNSSSNKWQSPGGGQGNQIMAFAIHSVPEPATYLLGLVAMMVLAAVSRRRRAWKPSLPPNT